MELISSEIDLVLGGQCESGYSCAYMNTVSWQSPTTPLPNENNPSVIFERMFGEGGTAEERIERMKKKAQPARSRQPGSRAAAAKPRSGRPHAGLGIPGGGARSGTTYPDSRSAERNVTLPVPERPVGIPARFDDHLKLLFDLQWLAFQSDLTRVFTLMYGRELNSRPYPEIGISEPHHGLSHHGDKPEQLEKYARLNAWQAELFAHFLERLRSTPDGDGNLLDHSILLYGGAMSNPNVHLHVNLPLVVAGGGVGRLKGGRHLAFAPADNVPMTNLLVSLLDKAGVRVDKLGDSSGKIDLDTLSGI